MSNFGDYLERGQGQIGQTTNDEKNGFVPLRSHAPASDLSRIGVSFTLPSHTNHLSPINNPQFPSENTSQNSINIVQLF